MDRYRIIFDSGETSGWNPEMPFASFEDQVCSMQEKGWEPIGGPFSVENGGLCQAMARPEKGLMTHEAWEIERVKREAFKTPAGLKPADHLIFDPEKLSGTTKKVEIR